jgi:hypothetical protein
MGHVVGVADLAGREPPYPDEIVHRSLATPCGLAESLAEARVAGHREAQASGGLDDGPLGFPG